MLCSGVCSCAEIAEKPDFKRFLGMKKVHDNSIRITVDFWRITVILIEISRGAVSRFCCPPDEVEKKFEIHRQTEICRFL